MLDPMTEHSTEQNQSPFKKASPVKVGPWTFGGESFHVIAGPCSVETQEQIITVAKGVREAGASFLRGGVFKMRTNPKSFQGLGDQGLHLMKEAKKAVGLPIVCELTDPRQIEEFLPAVDLIQVGSRNMHNYALLKELGQTDKPILLKRGFSATIEEWVLAAEYIRQGGNQQVILCERGIRSFERITRNTLDLSAVAWVKQNTDLPVIVDPSHATGIPSLILPMSLASLAAGADGLIIEVHNDPAKALSDGDQALDIPSFKLVMNELLKVSPVFHRRIERWANV